MHQIRLTGKVPAESIVQTRLPDVDAAIIKGFFEIGDLTGTVSDALDDLSIVGAVPGTLLHPSIPGSRIVGRALTIRNVAQQNQVHVAVGKRISKMGEIEAHNLTCPGDVLVIEGVPDISNMGGLSARIAHRQGQAGAIVHGAVRDIETSRQIGYPIWSMGTSPITGKWRIETIQINGTVHIGGVTVHPGDIVIADGNGVCFVPRDQSQAVLRRAQEIERAEALRQADIDAGVSVPDLKYYLYSS